MIRFLVRHFYICVIVSITLTIPHLALSQYSVPYTQKSLNKYAINSSYAGLDFSLSATAQYRSQWNGIEGAPETIYLGIHLPFYLWKGSVGMQVQRQLRGTISFNSVDLSYNHIRPMGSGLFSIGGRLGATFMNIDGSKVSTPDGNYDVVIQHNDPILPINNDYGLGPRWELATYFYTKTLEIGVSIIHLPDSKIYFDNFEIINKMKIQTYVEYKREILDQVKLRPNLYVSTDGKVLQTDIGTIAEFNGNVFGGVGVRGYNTTSLESLYMMVGTDFNENYRLSYSYDYALNNLSEVPVASHEVIFHYNLKRPIATGRPPKIIYNPRFL